MLNLNDPAHDDFELWSPSEERAEQCLFGAQVGSKNKALEKISFINVCRHFITDEGDRRIAMLEL